MRIIPVQSPWSRSVPDHPWKHRLGTDPGNFHAGRSILSKGATSVANLLARIILTILAERRRAADNVMSSTQIPSKPRENVLQSFIPM